MKSRHIYIFVILFFGFNQSIGATAKNQGVFFASFRTQGAVPFKYDRLASPDDGTYSSTLSTIALPVYLEASLGYINIVDKIHSFIFLYNLSYDDDSFNSLFDQTVIGKDVIFTFNSQLINNLLLFKYKLKLSPKTKIGIAFPFSVSFLRDDEEINFFEGTYNNFSVGGNFNIESKILGVPFQSSLGYKRVDFYNGQRAADLQEQFFGDEEQQVEIFSENYDQIVFNLRFFHRFTTKPNKILDQFLLRFHYTGELTLYTEKPITALDTLNSLDDDKEQSWKNILRLNLIYGLFRVNTKYFIQGSLVGQWRNRNSNYSEIVYNVSQNSLDELPDEITQYKQVYQQGSFLLPIQNYKNYHYWTLASFMNFHIFATSYLQTGLIAVWKRYTSQYAKYGLYENQIAMMAILKKKFYKTIFIF